MLQQKLNNDTYAKKKRTHTIQPQMDVDCMVTHKSNLAILLGMAHLKGLGLVIGNHYSFIQMRSEVNELEENIYHKEYEYSIIIIISIQPSCTGTSYTYSKNISELRKKHILYVEGTVIHSVFFLLILLCNMC